MNLLLVSATREEVKPLLDYIGKKGVAVQSEHDQLLAFRMGANLLVNVLITGVGMTATAFSLGKLLAKAHFSLAVQLGIAGTFDKQLSLGTVVLVEQDGFAELGAEDGDDFLSIFDLHLLKKNDFPYHEGWIQQDIPANYTASLLPWTKGKGITVNKVHGNEKSILEVKKRYDALTESMEGAAFMYACAMMKQTHMQLRSISNYVERRNREAWNIPLAVKNLNDDVIRWVESMIK